MNHIILKICQTLTLLIFLFLIDSIQMRTKTSILLKTTTIQTQIVTLKASSKTSTILFVETNIASLTSTWIAPNWVSTSAETTISNTITDTMVTSNIATSTVTQSVGYNLKYQESTTVTLPTVTNYTTRMMILNTDTTTVFVTINTLPVTSAPSILFCYNFI